MQFKGRPRGTFRDDARWRATPQVVEVTLDITDDDGTRSIPCRIARDALEDFLHRDDCVGDVAVDCYRAYRNRIHDAIDDKLKMGRFEDDGSILLRSADLGG